MTYLFFIGYGAFWSIPYCAVLRFLFLLLKIPFAMISRKAVHVCYAFYCFFIAHFFAGVALTAYVLDLSVFPFLIFFSLPTFLLCNNTVPKSDDENETRYWLIASFGAVAAFLFMSIQAILPFSALYAQVIDIIQHIFTIPVLGNILKTISPVLYLFAVIKIFVQFIYLLVLYMKDERWKKPSEKQ